MEPFASSPVLLGLLPPLLWMLPLLLLGALFAWFRPRLLGAVGEKAVSHVLRRLFAETLDDVILPDGRGGLTQIDHLALTAAGLLVVETKNYGGSILGQAYEPTWTQVIGGQRNRFQNPLRQNFGHIEAVKFHAPGVPVLGRVVFTNRTRFPKGMPEGVVALAGLRSSLQALLGGEILPQTHLAWEQLRGVVRADYPAKAEHLAGIRQRHGHQHGAAVRSVPLLSRGMLHVLVLVIGVLVGLSALSMLPRHITRIAQHQATALASIPRPSTSAPTADQRFARLPSAPVRARPSAPAASSHPTARPPQITWSEPSPWTRHREACNAAIAALLTNNSPEHRRQRDQSCGAEAGDNRVPDRATARVSATTRVLRSAAELTRERREP